MTIDTNELRRLAQAAMHPVTKGRWMRLFGERTVYDRMEDGCRGIPVVSTPFSPPHPFEAACLDFIAAANPTAISELLDRLEAAEADALEQARLNGMGSEREAALMAKLEAAEKSDAESLAMYRRARDERDALRAKIARMERQEPVAWARKLAMGLPSFGCVTDLKYRPSNIPESSYIPLYALPGAQTQPTPSIPEGWKLVPIEPTEDMLRAMTDPFIAINGDNRKAFEIAYTAMLSAAPEVKP